MTHSHLQAPLLTSQVQLHVCWLPGIHTLRKKGRMFWHFQHFCSAFFSVLATNFYLFFPTIPFQNAHFSRMQAFRQGKPPLYFVANYVLYAQYRMRSAILRNNLKLYYSQFLSTYWFLWGHELANWFLSLRLHSFFFQIIMNFSFRQRLHFLLILL